MGVIAVAQLCYQAVTMRVNQPLSTIVMVIAVAQLCYQAVTICVDQPLSKIVQVLAMAQLSKIVLVNAMERPQVIHAEFVMQILEMIVKHVTPRSLIRNAKLAMMMVVQRTPYSFHKELVKCVKPLE